MGKKYININWIDLCDMGFCHSKTKEEANGYHSVHMCKIQVVRASLNSNFSKKQVSFEPITTFY